MTSNTASLSDPFCDWCGEKEWYFRCIICDPRRTKHLCPSCTILWHSRGFSQDHLIDWKGSEAAGVKYLPFRVLYMRYPQLFETKKQKKCVKEPVASTPEEIDGESVSESAEIESDEREHKPAQEYPHTPTDKEKEDGTTEQGTINGSGGNSPEDNSISQTISTTKAAAFSLWPTIDYLLQSISNNEEKQEKLKERIFDACKVEDARFCNSVQTREKHLTCQTLSMHYDHFQKKQLCDQDNQCCFISQVYSHINQCLNARECPFCAPVMVRRQQIWIVGLRYQLGKKKKVLESSGRDCSTTDPKVTLRKQQAVNYLQNIQKHLQYYIGALNEWKVVCRQVQFDYDSLPLIHHGSAHVKVEDCMMSDLDEIPTKKRLKLHDILATDNEADKEVSTTEQVKDCIRCILDDPKNIKKKKLAEYLTIGFAIADAAFCVSNFEQCLLDCNNINQHITHHSSRTRCDEAVCEKVAVHFVHQESCQKTKQEQCEYCLRVKERTQTRMVELFERQLLQFGAKCKALKAQIHSNTEGDKIAELEKALQDAQAKEVEAAERMEEMQMKRCKLREHIRRQPFGVLFKTSYQRPPVHFIKLDAT